MPKITAPTVVEHREAQHAALVRAAGDLLRATGVAGVTPAAVCERAGLNRSSFYDYFPSRDDLLVAVAIEAFRQWNRDVSSALAGVEAGLPRLRAYVDATIRMSAAREHDIAGPLREANLAPKHMEDLMELHDTLSRPLIDLVAELGVPDAERYAGLAEGVLGSAMRLVQHGADPASTADAAFRLLSTGLPAPKR